LQEAIAELEKKNAALDEDIANALSIREPSVSIKERKLESTMGYN
jgi:Mn-dependent DtxR family transcriptional regulator